jgi:hypothetical protein
MTCEVVIAVLQWSELGRVSSNRPNAGLMENSHNINQNPLKKKKPMSEPHLYPAIHRHRLTRYGCSTRVVNGRDR